MFPQSLQRGVCSGELAFFKEAAPPGRAWEMAKAPCPSAQPQVLNTAPGGSQPPMVPRCPQGCCPLAFPSCILQGPSKAGLCGGSRLRLGHKSAVSAQGICLTICRSPLRFPLGSPGERPSTEEPETCGLCQMGSSHTSEVESQFCLVKPRGDLGLGETLGRNHLTRLLPGF